MAKIAWLLGATLALSPALVNALVLGRIKVHSALNEPLNAEIEISSIADKELKALNVSLAPRAEFDAAGVERLSFLSGIKFTVAKRLDGRYVLQLTTDQQIEEPFLHLLLQVDWPGGRLVREYSALIDPPAQFFAKPSGIQPPRVSTAPAQPQPEVAPEPTAIAATPAAPVEELKPEPPAAAAVAPTPDAAKPELAATPEAAPAVTTLPEPKDDQLAVADDQRLFGPPSIGAAEAAPEVEALAPQERKPDAVAATEVAAPVAKSSAGWTNVGEYAVKRGDTLWEIAQKVRTDKRVATEQVILAIYRTNPDAFFGKNVNNLYAGRILKMPERDEVESLAAGKARSEFRAQYDVWQEYRLKLAASSTAIKVTAAPAAESPAQEAAKPVEKPREVAGQSAKQPDELLKIVRANLQGEKGTPEKKVAETDSAKDAKERQALADRVSALEESLLSRQMETKDVADKIGAVRDQLKREARLIEIESQQLAQAKAPKPETAVKPEPVKPSESPKPEVAKTEPPKIEVPQKTEPVAAAPIEKKPRRVGATPPPPPAPAASEKGFVDEILESELLPFMLGGVVLLSGGIGFLYWRRRRKAIGEFEESILTSDSMSSESPASTMTTADTGAQVASAGDTSFLSDFSQGGVGAVHTDEVDPIAEAEVYLAYGRDETAEEILKDAVVKHPERNELKVKLLEIYNQRNDVKAFETVAEELYAALGGRRDKAWEKVEEMGRKLNPGNPMFSGGVPAKRSDAGVGRPTPPGAAAAPRSGAEAPTMVFTPDLAPPAGEPVNMARDSGGLDFDLGAPEPEAVASPSIDFDLGGLGSAAPQAEEEVPIRSVAEQLGLEEESSGGGLASIDFGASSDHGQASGGGIDFDLGAPAEELSAAPSSEGGVAAPGGGVDFDMDLGAGGAAAGEAPAAEGASGQWDETATKLDLARAYIDMGDAEGARSILDEVMSEGNADQKRQAKELSGQLGA